MTTLGASWLARGNVASPSIEVRLPSALPHCFSNYLRVLTIQSLLLMVHGMQTCLGVSRLMFFLEIESR